MKSINQNIKLSIIIPCYNEKFTIEKIIKKIFLTKLKLEIIIVDDASNDGTKEILKSKIAKKVKKIIYHKKNFGKGSAINSAKKYVNGQIIIIQDADLEYYPSDYKKLIQPIIKKETKVVYGSRVLGRQQKNYKSKYTSRIRILGNFILTFISNIINKQSLTDAHTCYKVIHKSVFKKIKLIEKDFRFCPEITSKISRIGERIVEKPIKYNGRNTKEGKKIRLQDAFLAVHCLFKYGLFKK